MLSIRAGILAIVAILTLVPSSIQAEEHPSERWEDEIEQLESLDSELAPPPGCILFTGSSSIRMWDLRQHMPKLQAVNRGFGGSQM
ncbi:MAG: hypothetical protein KDA92_06260, partial [Planctomycetales bacterium]|nr:hypothetical protein [Planctomycetales bacterium]